MTSKKPGLDDKLSILELRIVDGKIDDMTAVQTLDSLISEDPKSLNPKSYAHWLERIKIDTLWNIVGEFKQVGRLQRKINLFDKASDEFPKRKGGKK